MKTYVISLERTPDRLQEFAHTNGQHVDYEVFPAVDGQQGKTAALLGRGIAEAALDYTPGALGNALSHYQLWMTIASHGKAATICEDDAVLHRSFPARSRAIVSRLPREWDIILWGWNFDSVLVSSPSGVFGPSVTYFDQDSMRNKLGRFQDSRYGLNVHRLYNAFGTLCYSISPKGAKAMMKLTFPLKNEKVFVAGMNCELDTISLDIAMNRHYKDLQSFVSFPPLALSPNDHARSTVVAKRRA